MKVFSYTVILYLTCILSAQCADVKIRSDFPAVIGYDTNLPTVDFGLDDDDEFFQLCAIGRESSCAHRDIIKANTANLRRALKEKEKTLRCVIKKYRSDNEKKAETKS